MNEVVSTSIIYFSADCRSKRRKTEIPFVLYAEMLRYIRKILAKALLEYFTSNRILLYIVGRLIILNVEFN